MFPGYFSEGVLGTPSYTGVVAMSCSKCWIRIVETVVPTTARVISMVWILEVVAQRFFYSSGGVHFTIPLCKAVLNLEHMLFLSCAPVPTHTILGSTSRGRLDPLFLLLPDTRGFLQTG